MNQPAAQQQQSGIPPIQRICNTLTGDEFKAKLQQALPLGVDADRYCRTAVNAIQMHPQKNKFENCDRQTLFLSVQKAATDGLLLDGREATLTAFWNKKKNTNDIQYIPMTQGMVKIARNSGEIASIDAHVVYEHDQFRFRPGFDPQPIFEPDWKLPPSQRGEPVLAFCVIHLKDGTIIAPAPMHAERILQIGNAGNNGAQYDPKVGPHYGEWWKKTAIKNALKYAPKSSELQRLEDNDNEAQGFDFNKLRDITNAAGVDINELFKPRPVASLSHVDTETGDTEEQYETGPGLGTQKPAPEEEPAPEPPADTANSQEAPQPEEPQPARSPALSTLLKELEKAETVDACQEIYTKPAIGRLNATERNELAKTIEAKCKTL